jgi:hypothetical protein
LVQVFHLEEALEHRLRYEARKHLDLEGRLRPLTNQFGSEQ